MSCLKGCSNPSIHNHIREIDGECRTIAYICFICRGEWWASKEYKDRFGKPTDPYWDSESNSIKSDSVRTCPKCNGSGWVEDACNHLAITKECELCEGTGKIPTESDSKGIEK